MTTSEYGILYHPSQYQNAPIQRSFDNCPASCKTMANQPIYETAHELKTFLRIRAMKLWSKSRKSICSDKPKNNSCPWQWFISLIDCFPVVRVVKVYGTLKFLSVSLQQAAFSCGAYCSHRSRMTWPSASRYFMILQAIEIHGSMGPWTGQHPSMVPINGTHQ